MAKKKVEEEKIVKPKAIGPYDIIKMIFTDKDQFNSLSKNILSKNFFMINRIFAIQFPLQANCFNKLSNDSALVIKAWADFACRKIGYGRVPGFVFTRGAKASEDKKEQENDFSVSKDDKIKYCLHYNISLKDFDDMLELNTNIKNHFNEFIEIENNKNIFSEEK